MNQQNIEAIYPLSPMQEGMLFHSLMAPESGMYFEQLICTLEGDLNPAAFQQAWQQIVARHPVLRTAFVWKRLEKNLQVVQKQVEVPFEEIDWRDLTATEQTRRLEEFLRSDQQRGFKLNEAPLFRLTLFRLNEARYQFILSNHHLLLDGWSLPILFKEVLTCYEAFHQQRPVHLPSVRPYREYIAWLQKQDLDAAEQYWRKTLNGFTAPTPLVVEQPSGNASAENENYLKKAIYLSEETTTALQNLARTHRLTLNSLVQAAWAILLSRYSGEEDVVFGATVAGRPPQLPEVESMVGLFINTLPVRVTIDSCLKLSDWLNRLNAQQFEMRQFEYCSLTQIHGWSEVPRDLPLFHSILVFENYPVNQALQQRAGSMKVSDIHAIEKTNYPLTVVSGPGRELPLEIAYNTENFREDTIQRLLQHLAKILESFVENPSREVGQIQILTATEAQQILIDWNNTRVDFPQEKCIHQLFEEVVAQFPANTALTFQNQTVTYEALNQRANQLARFLRKQGVGPEVLVGIFVERSPEMIIGIMGILKAGGAYLPLDSQYPEERLDFMLTDTNAPVLLTQEHLLTRLPITTQKVVKLDTDWEAIARESNNNLGDVGLRPENLSYVIYTSGSTGRPKGVQLHHRGVGSFIQFYSRLFEIGPQDHVLQFFSYSFDGSVADIFVALFSGATLCLIDQDNVLPGPGLVQLMRNQQITFALLPPAVLAALPVDEVPTLKKVASGGESTNLELVKQWTPSRTYFNLYGPTEATVVATAFKTNNFDSEEDNIPIGRPIDNTQLYLVDEHLRPVPVDIPGELLIGGVGLARGYLNRPELTAEKLIPNPFATEPGERLYKTGDLVRYRPDGNIEFLGRIDHQVKLRGFRIELGEIEAVLNQHAAVQRAVVLAREDEPGEKRLVAYFVTDNSVDAPPDSQQFYIFLKEKLPEYMVPAFFVPLEKFPLTPSGKIDRKKLPRPDESQLKTGRAYVAPRTPDEEVLAGIMADVLGLKQVGIDDNFFELGGHSLLGIKLQSRIRNTYQIELPLVKIFESPTVAQLAQLIEITRLAEQGIEVPPIVPLSRDQELPLSFAQQRLWFLDQLEPDSPFYNIPGGLRLTGKLRVEALEASLNQLVQRHEVLRTRFKSVQGKPQPEILPGLALTIHKIDLTPSSAEQQAEQLRTLALQEAQQPFNLSEGPLFRVKLLKLSESEHIILFTLHHIISDGWSVGILIREVVVLYEAFIARKPSPLPPLQLQYADFAAWQRQWLQNEVLEVQLNYWKTQLKGSPPLLEMPTDRPRPPVVSFHGKTFSTIFPKKLLQDLQQLSQQKNVTLFMTLLAGFYSLLYRYTGQSDINVGTPHANRNRLEIEKLIGFFVNTLVLRADLKGNPTFNDFLQQVRKVAFAAYAHQDLPFEMLVEALQPVRDLSYTPLFQVMFVFQNVPAEKLTLPGLSFTPYEINTGIAKFDLSLILAEVETGLAVSFEYNRDLFNETTIERMSDHFQNLLQAIVANPEARISHLALFSEAEKQLLNEWNATEAAFPDHLCVHQWFESLVSDQPDAIAVKYEDQQLTYRELNQRANQLARYLRKLALPPEGRVGICLDRSLEMVVSIFATLKAGGAFVPLDPAYPPERLAYMINDSQISVLLTEDGLVDQFRQYPLHLVKVATEWDKIAQENPENLNLAVDPDNLAYVIYTSGSTGKPKGTLLQHRGWCNLALAQQQAFGVGPGNRILQFSSLSFDASVWEVGMALLSGATLNLAPRDRLTTGQGLLQVLEQGKITNITLPPSVLAVLPKAPVSDLATIITAGEACSADLVARWANGRQFFNAYGPTETTVCAAMFLAEPDGQVAPPIGKPLPNFKLYVLDANLEPVPIGVPGELCISSVALARGYWQQPDLTAEKFIPDPFSHVPGTRMYRSGDRVKYLPDGNIEFLGRIDHQVKLRGFRIELGEIESILSEHPLVQDAVVVVKQFQAGDDRLVAYLVLEPETDLAANDLRNYLRQQLPDYMLPAAFVFLPEFPLTPNGKVDRQALPEPTQTRAEAGQEYVAPRNKTETQLAAICTDLLQVEQVGIDDNFFELGGHSLLATQFISRVRETFEVELPLRSLFEAPTFRQLAEIILEQSAAKPAESQSRIESDRRGSKDLAHLLAEFEQLSDEDAQQLLAEELATEPINQNKD